MYLRQNNHAPAAIELMCGTNRPGLPAMGAWMTYGLGAGKPGRFVPHINSIAAGA